MSRAALAETVDHHTPIRHRPVQDRRGANLYCKPDSISDYTLDITDGTKPTYSQELYSARHFHASHGPVERPLVNIIVKVFPKAAHSL